MSDEVLTEASFAFLGILVLVLTGFACGSEAPSLAFLAAVAIISFSLNAYKRVHDRSEARYKQMEALVEEARTSYEETQKKLGTLQNELTQVRMVLQRPSTY